MKSNRPDKRGHWPTGKRRNPRPPAGLLPKLRRAHMRGTVTYRGLGRQLGGDGTTVARWARGEDHPSPQYVRRLQSLL